MMCIQTPGSYVWAGSLAARLGWAGWSTWGLFLVTGLLQGTVLAMGIYFELRNRDRKQDGTGGPVEAGVGTEEYSWNQGDQEAQESNEQTPLLNNER